MLPVEDPKKVSRLVLMAQMSEIAERLAYSVDYPHIGHQQRQILMAFRKYQVNGELPEAKFHVCYQPPEFRCPYCGKRDQRWEDEDATGNGFRDHMWRSHGLTRRQANKIISAAIDHQKVIEGPYQAPAAKEGYYTVKIGEEVFRFDGSKILKLS